MHEVHLVPVLGTDPIAAVERACSAIGLAVTLRGTLAACPGSTHWHVKKDNERGTLEVTWWPKTGELWFKVAANRDASWIDAAIKELAADIEGP